jgi:DNA-binding helix-hairpin-helix protein with protein kinase domain
MISDKTPIQARENHMKQRLAIGTVSVEMETKPAVTSFGVLKQFCQAAWRLQEREKSRIRAEIQQVPGLIPLLMKPRNGLPWSKEDRAELTAQLQCMGRLGLYLTVLAIPGTSLTLPLLAWWLDRRRFRRPAP